MNAMSRQGMAHALGSLALLGALGLAACSSEMQARSVAAGTSAPIGKLDDWGFGGQSMQPGYLYNQSSMGATGPQYRRGDLPTRETYAAFDIAGGSCWDPG
jgi:hypothetical protein